MVMIFVMITGVHFTSYPQPNELLVDKNMVENFKNLQAVINLGRTARERRTMPLRVRILFLSQNKKKKAKED